MLVAVCLTGAASGRAAEPLRMLVLFGSSDVGAWSQAFSSAFLHEAAISSHRPAVSISTEYLGLYQTGTAGLDNVRSHLEFRQQVDPVDVVIAVQGVAGRFLADHGDALYPGVSRLYVLPGRPVAADVAGQPDSAVLLSSIVPAIAATVSSIEQVMPRARRVWVITGNQMIDQIYHDHARQAIASIPQPPPVEFLHGLDLEALRTRLAGAPPGTAALLLTYEGDPAGNIYRTGRDVLPRLLEVSSVPLFGAYDSLFGEGIVGGVMTSTARYGEQAARMALALANGDAAGASAGPAVLRTAFDAAALRRHGLRPGLVPAGSELINQTAAGYLDYLWEFALALAVIVVQLGLIIALWRLLRQRGRAERRLSGQARELERQKTLFESVLNSIPEAIVITDVASVIIATNAQGFRRTFGFDPARIIGVHSRVLTGESGLPEAEPTAAGARVMEFVGDGGRRFPGEGASTRVLTESGEHLGFVMIVRDVTERLAVEEERRQSHKMEALGSLAGGIAHDFNNILTVMLGNAELIQAGVGDARQSVVQILQAGGRARDLVGQILAFSRRGNSSAMGPVDLRALAEESAAFLRASLPANVGLDVNIEPHVGLMVHGNEGQLQQVLMNLGANARDAIGRGAGNLTLLVESRVLPRGAVVSHGVVQQGRYVCVEVRDSGPGMGAGVLQRAFDPFYTTKGPGAGTGMGLALVYGVVQTHAGSIDLRSAPGQGTTFTIYLPALEVTLHGQLDTLAADGSWRGVQAAHYTRSAGSGFVLTIAVGGPAAVLGAAAGAAARVRKGALHGLAHEVEGVQIAHLPHAPPELILVFEEREDALLDVA
jgi:PAS domain S-box-containing protein